jgi:hydroxyquinol 1,2-dioxygenase
MLRKMGRHPNRPGHIHMKVYGPGLQPVTTHLFVADSPYLESDAVFGVRDSLIVPFEKHPPGIAPDGRKMDVPYHSARYDFKLVREAKAA